MPLQTKENSWLSHGGPSQRQASGTNPPMKALGQGRHMYLRPGPRAIKEENEAINHDCGYNKAYRLFHNIRMLYLTFYNVWLSF